MLPQLIGSTFNHDKRFLVQINQSDITWQISDDCVIKNVYIVAPPIAAVKYIHCDGDSAETWLNGESIITNNHHFCCNFGRAIQAIFAKQFWSIDKCYLTLLIDKIT